MKPVTTSRQLVGQELARIGTDKNWHWSIWRSQVRIQEKLRRKFIGGLPASSAAATWNVAKSFLINNAIRSTKSTESVILSVISQQKMSNYFTQQHLTWQLTLHKLYAVLNRALTSRLFFFKHLVNFLRWYICV